MRYLTDEEKQLIREWVLAGRAWSWISHELDRAPMTVQRYIYELDGTDPDFAMKRRRKASHMTDDEKRLVRKWLLEGASWMWMREQLGRSHSTIARYAKYLDRTDPEVAERRKRRLTAAE